MTCARKLIRTTAALGTIALAMGLLATDASAAPSRKTPAPKITVKPAAQTNMRSATFEFTDALAGATFSCSLDGGAYKTCTSPETYAGPLAVRSHSFRVRASAPGHRPSVTAKVTWTIDVTAPPKPLLSGIPVPSPTAKTGATLTFSDSERGTTLLCSLDGIVSTPCTSPLAITGLHDGDHTFAVTARDAAGNVSPPNTGSWAVDSTPPPDPTITTGPANPTNQTVATFLVADDEASATFTCKLDGNAYQPCGTKVEYGNNNPLAPGTHTFSLRASDALGNQSKAVQFTWTIDVTAPQPPAIVSGPGSYTNHRVGSFTFTRPATATQLECSLDGAAYAGCDSTYTTPELADGPHSLLVHARSAASNVSGATPYNWIVDTVAPAAPMVAGPAALTTSTTAQFIITDTAADTAGFTCTLDGGQATPCTSGKAYSSLADGPHSLTVTAADQAGNTASSPYDWRIDALAPTASLAAPASLSGAVKATFSEPVKGVSTSSLQLRIANSTTARPATVACRTADGAVVSCAVGPVKSATLRPAGPLTPGERYVAIANPTAHASITDVAGNPLPRTAKSSRLTTVQENSVAARYTWHPMHNASAFGGAYQTAKEPRASMSYPFTGTGITWYTVKGPNQGFANVYVDGRKKATVNDFAARTAFKIGRSITGLANAKHTLRIVVAGREGSTKATGTYVSVDAVKVAGHPVVKSPALSGKWRFAAVKAASGGFVAVGDLAGETATTTFKGTSIAWYTSTGRDRGIAKVYIDGALKGTYDLYGSTTRYGVRRVIGNLTNAVHTVRLVATGTHRSGARDSVVVLDRWVVG